MYWCSVFCVWFWGWWGASINDLRWRGRDWKILRASSVRASHCREPRIKAFWRRFNPKSPILMRKSIEKGCKSDILLIPTLLLRGHCFQISNNVSFITKKENTTFIVLVSNNALGTTYFNHVKTDECLTYTTCLSEKQLEGFPKYIYVKTVDSLINVFTMSRTCCVVTRLAASCCCRSTVVASGRDIDFSEKYHVFLSGGHLRRGRFAVRVLAHGPGALTCFAIPRLALQVVELETSTAFRVVRFWKISPRAGSAA